MIPIFSIPFLLNLFGLKIPSSYISYSQNYLPKIYTSYRLNQSYSLKSNEILIEKDKYNFVFEKLDQADKLLQPRLIKSDKGKLTYHYKRNPFHKPLNHSQIKYINNNPPDYAFEKQYIKSTLDKLDALGVLVVLTQYNEKDISGEWIHDKLTLKIDMDILDFGTLSFSNILNHEVIHVSQSCKAGSPSSTPKILGLKPNLNREKLSYLSSKIYTKLTRGLEIEAYSYQENLKVGTALINKYCFKK